MNNLTFIAYNPEGNYCGKYEQPTYCSHGCNCVLDQKSSDFVFKFELSKEEIIELLRKYKDHESVRVMHNERVIIEDGKDVLWYYDGDITYDGPLASLVEQILGSV